MGRVLCRTCKLTVCLGKLHRDESRQPVGFVYAGIDDGSLGAVVLCLMAQHVKHEVIVARDDVLYETNLGEYDSLSLEGTPTAFGSRARRSNLRRNSEHGSNVAGSTRLATVQTISSRIAYRYPDPDAARISRKANAPCTGSAAKDPRPSSLSTRLRRSRLRSGPIPRG
jgi:hypothetical protein